MFVKIVNGEFEEVNVKQERWQAYVSVRTPTITRRTRNPDKRQGISTKTVVKLALMQEGKCAKCATQLKDYNGKLNVHHKVPVSMGGCDDLENLELLCRACHVKEHARQAPLGVDQPKEEPKVEV